MTREKMFRAEMLHEELTGIEEQLRQMDDHLSQLHATRDALVRIGEMQPGERTLVPLANGIFVRATLTGEEELFANVGAGIMVPKSRDELHLALGEHVSTIEQRQQQLQTEFNKKLEELGAIQDEFNKAKE